MDNMSFTWFADFRDLLEDLSGSEEDAMILAVVKYGMYGDLPEFTGTTMALFKSFAKDVDYSKKKRGNGGRGGRPKTSKPNSENQSENLPENQGANVVKTTENQPENLLENPEQNSTEQNSVKQNTPPLPPEGEERGGFEKPSVQEVADYISEMGYSFTAKEFVSFYGSKGWRVGEQPMVDWRSACDSWEIKRTGPGRDAPPPSMPPRAEPCPECGALSWPIDETRQECPRCGEWSQ